MNDKPRCDDLPQDAYPPLILTGERTLPGISEENYWFQRHLFAYRQVLPLLFGKRVVDLGCGEGYGVALMGECAALAVGIDLAPEAIYHARAKYADEKVRFDYGDVFSLPYADGEFDVAVSLQVIEHLREPASYMNEMRRVLAPGGIAVITTPNRLIISPGQDTPICPFHLFEFDPREFSDFLDGFFPEHRIQGVFHGRRLAGFHPLEGAEPAGWGRLLPRRLALAHRSRCFVPSIRASHFRLEETRLDEALDFLAICVKEA
ncbi:MAG: class I SAM-dependent methyltransferase [Candidatus Geothermincolia bacterium]